MKLTHMVFLMLFTMVVCPSQGLARTAKVTIVVVNENAQPVEGARVGIVFETTRSFGQVGVNSHPINGLTDSEGKSTAQHQNDSNYIHFGVEKEGYYFSSGEYLFSDRALSNWLPWNPELKIVMRKIENPVPMYARKVNIDLPALGENIGFDLVVYDFVRPYGRGTYSDLIFNASKHVENKRNYEAILKISFSNKYDGIVYYKEDHISGSEFKLPRFAPTKGYSDRCKIVKTRTPETAVKVGFSKDDNFIFRIRSKEKEGNLEKAMYGKILGPISFGNITRRDTATIIFKYYLNPDSTRNLEFNPKRNLFRKLPSLERVGIK